MRSLFFFPFCLWALVWLLFFLPFTTLRSAIGGCLSDTNAAVNKGKWIFVQISAFSSLPEYMVILGLICQETAWKFLLEIAVYLYPWQQKPAPLLCVFLRKVSALYSTPLADDTSKHAMQVLSSFWRARTCLLTLPLFLSLRADFMFWWRILAQDGLQRMGWKCWKSAMDRQYAACQRHMPPGKQAHSKN